MHLVQEKILPMSILRYSEDEITLTNGAINTSVCLSASTHQPWPVKSLKDLTPADFECFASPEIILLSTNEAIPLLLPVNVRCHFANARIGIEVMSIGALCRTFNLLLQEGRCVAAGLIFSDK